MKQILLSLTAIVLLAGCSFLNEPVYTKQNATYLYTSVEGMQSAIIGMYYRDRELLRNHDDGETTTYLALLMGDDITVPRAGEGIPQFGRYNNLMSSNAIVGRYWKFNYTMIEYANTVIEARKNVDTTLLPAQQALAEAYTFRAHAYLRLWQRYDRIYLTTHSVTINGLDQSVKEPATNEQVYGLIQQDLQYAIVHLPLTVTDPGRFTRGAARHILAKAAAYYGDWQTTAQQVDSIEASGVYALLPETKDVFYGANLNHQEAILVSQWANSVGGWYTNNNVNPVTNTGHRMSLHFTPNYNQMAGMVISFESGGYPWGRLFPNQHLLDLYDKQHDKRYTDYYKHHWVYTENTGMRGKNKGDTVRAKNSAEYLNIHPMCTKYMDSWTKATPQDNQSFKDVIIYRLAETYLLGCEAYLHLGNMGKARAYFNKTYTRAGNTAWTADITMDDLADEHARELAMEGDRWTFLKREGLLLTNVRKYGGEYLVVNNVELSCDTVIRTNIKDYNVRWPIPLTQIELMDVSHFPQNEGY